MISRQDALWGLQNELEEVERRKDLTSDFFERRADLIKKIHALKKSMADDLDPVNG
ncbi:hypothetical protein PP935_gp222 [Rhizobium phage RHph_N34]|uniref:Uncharacterized protein n=2 Tax=Trinifflemingvirus TaxID=3044848 RepID=A0A7S5UZQ7_9CAUD|nr:hypothetical protein PP935_gp222 [Rhizobium phage RHph_N34]YP_010661859.1 hypothetical protein PP936_gp221 [Rhizobium phage RHph_I1_9]QIG69792.1 hypothetical protein EVB81_223 [Rhizobium phage RHph_I46]QIG71073.1 hypothetical protein EVB92_223 [Rhizobium phage RHph_I9]QIG76412.1 hypothetical protein EVC25_223 [Rhizobium phage RHph_I34]QIG73658.1 hypothetical protein EVC04_221 [Rhizobium phage RHph_I1_9]QIG73997.1 hypothetical protein EVC06_222 [Rhizobium phage RHph_N34]